MKTSEIAGLALQRARRWLRGAQVALEDGRWDDAVYASQMCSEHGAKAVLISFGIDFPKKHDVSSAFATLSARPGLPAWFTSKVDTIVGILGELASERAMAGYGFEEGIDAEYFKDYAPEAVRKAENALGLCSRLVKSLFGGGTKKS